MKITMMLLMIFLSSCQTIPNAPKISPKVSCDAFIRQLPDGNFNGRCNCRCLNLNDIDSPLIDMSMCDSRYSGDSISLSLLSCHQIVGFKLKTYAEEVRPWLIELSEFFRDALKK